MILLLGKHSYARYQTPLKNHAHRTYKDARTQRLLVRWKIFGAASLGGNSASDLLLNVNIYIARKNYRPITENLTTSLREKDMRE